MKINAYRTVKHPMELVPASNRRQWMDETPYQYAYRCLPLQIANANGWELRAPSEILISWNGGNHKQDLTVHFENDEIWNYAASSFGSGIVTFHPGYLFKTIGDVKYDLLVTGLANHWYDFMVPLTGVVETWWNPATFTMNYKLLQPGTYQIRKGDPLVFLTLLPHELPEIEATICQMKDDPDVWREYHDWSAKRTRTIRALEHMDQTGEGVDGIDPANPATHWEKDYFRGKSRDGSRVEEHHTKRRYPSFSKEKEG